MRAVASAKAFPVWGLLREARHKAGLSQRELARRAGTSQSAIARYERGRVTPDIDTLFRLARACGQDLRLTLEPYDPHDEALLRQRLAASPAERARLNRQAVRVAVRAAEARRHGRVRRLADA
ncbi:hypothetical protein BH20ACT8_BH20ACT8_09160 [soil metagenome]